jgi:hypothetical protein
MRSGAGRAVGRSSNTGNATPLRVSDRTGPFAPTEPDAKVLAADEHQPHLERRHAPLKGVQLVAPAHSKDVARIEGLSCCHFVALLVQALVERATPGAMAATGVASIPLCPEDRGREAPSAPRTFEISSGLARHQLIGAGRVVQTFAPALTSPRGQVLDLLDVPQGACDSTSRNRCRDVRKARRRRHPTPPSTAGAAFRRV